MESNRLTIGQVAKRVGLQTSAIRYYEELGLIKAPPRVSGMRRYSPDVLHEIAIVQLAQAGGLTLAQIHDLLHGFADATPASERWQQLAQTKLTEVDMKIEQLLKMKNVLTTLLQCTCEELTQCVENNE